MSSQESQSELGFSLGAGYDIKNSGGVHPRFTLSFDNYGGKVKNSSNSAYYPSSSSVNIRKNCLTIGIYPLSFSVEEKLKVSLGIEFAFLLFDYSSPEVSTPFNVGLRGRLAYEIKLSDEWNILPQFHYSLGLTNEADLRYIVANTMRFYFLIGIAKKFS